MDIHFRKYEIINFEKSQNQRKLHFLFIFLSIFLFRGKKHIDKPPLISSVMTKALQKKCVSSRHSIRKVLLQLFLIYLIMLYMYKRFVLKLLDTCMFYFFLHKLCYITLIMWNTLFKKKCISGYIEKNERKNTTF